MAEKKSALIIANSQYEDPILRQLVAPSQDAEALAQVLRDPAICGFEVETILNEPRYRVEEQIEAFFSDCDRNDLLLLYFSGHGVTDEDGLLYYAASNTHHKRLRSTAVSAGFVNESMTRCRSRRQVLLLDCCHSGAFARTKAAPSVNLGEHFGGAGGGRGRFILASSDAYQYSFEGDAVNGSAIGSVFTSALIDGLRSGEADHDGDGIITLDELYDYVHRRVTDQTPNQSPRKWAYEVDGSLMIAHNPRPAEVALPEDVRLAIDNFVPEAREAGIRRLDVLLRGKHRGLSLAALRALEALRDDDSRRVAGAAERSLAAWAQETSAEQAPPAVTSSAPAAASAPAVAPKKEVDRAAEEKARREQDERERIAAEEKARQEREERERQQRKAAAEQARREEQARLAEEKRAREAATKKERQQREERERQAAEAARAEEAHRTPLEEIRRERAELERREAGEQADDTNSPATLEVASDSLLFGGYAAQKEKPVSGVITRRELLIVTGIAAGGYSVSFQLAFLWMIRLGGSAILFLIVALLITGAVSFKQCLAISWKPAAHLGSLWAACFTLLALFTGLGIYVGGPPRYASFYAHGTFTLGTYAISTVIILSAVGAVFGAGVTWIFFKTMGLKNEKLVRVCAAVSAVLWPLVWITFPIPTSYYHFQFYSFLHCVLAAILCSGAPLWILRHAQTSEPKPAS